jgi:autophagy-related protein 2
LPANLFLSGSVEILVNDVRVAIAVAPLSPDDDASTATPSPPPTPRPGDNKHVEMEAVDSDEFPATVEDLAESFLQSQSRAEKQQLMSLYAEAPMAASVMSSTTSAAIEDEYGDIGVGTSMGLPRVLASMFKGIADRMVVRIRGVKVSLEATLPEDRGGEKVLLEVEVEDVDVEGVSRNVVTSTSRGAPERPRKEGKRRITLENIRGFITSVETMFGPAEGTVFGEASEAGTARRDSGEEDCTTTETVLEPSPDDSSTLSRSKSPPKSRRRRSSSEDDNDGIYLNGSPYSDEDKFTDFDDSDEEVLAFAPHSMRSSTTKPMFLSRTPSHILPELHFSGIAEDDDEDSEDEMEGGAIFAPSLPQPRSPSASVNSADASPFSSPTLQKYRPLTESPPLQEIKPVIPASPYISDPETSGDEMDQEASKMLSQSTIFSREEADSLYMSATSGMLRSKSELRKRYQMDEREGEGEEIDAEEMDQRLDKLINGELDIPNSLPPPPGADAGRTESPPSHKTGRKIRKQCLELDVITIFYPSLADGIVAVDEELPPSGEESGEHMPGAFSTYASKYTSKPPAMSSSPPAARPRVKIVDSVEARPPAPMVDQILSGLSHDKVADIEIIGSNIHGTVDIQTEKMLGWVFETIQSIFSEASPAPAGPGSLHTKEKKKTIQLIAEEIDVRMIKHLGGVFTDDQQGDPEDGTVLLQCLLNDVNIFHKGLADDASTSRLSVKKFALNDEEEGIITFLRPDAPHSSTRAKMSTSHHRKRSSTSTSASGLLGFGSGDDDDITVIFSRSTKKMRVNVVTQLLKLRGDLKRLEETFSAFGGVGSVLASTTASTATIRNNGRPPWQQRESGTLEPGGGVDTKIDCRLAGLMFDVVGTTGRVSMKTSPVKIKFATAQGVTIGIDIISISGPAPGRKDANIVIEGARMEFTSRPSQEDLGRLLELLTPSKDRFDDDDILVDTLLRQREQGSVLRINVAGVRGELLDISIFDQLKKLGEEVIQVLTVTDFVAGDERPGLLTLCSVEGVYLYAEIGGSMGRVEAEMDSVGITHVSAPSLLAMAIGTISVRRNDHEELLGEGIDRRVFSTAGLGRPMIMIRMVGDEPEPVVKVKLWNIRAEYSVHTLMELTATPEGATGEELVQDVVNSIVLPLQKDTVSDTGALGFDIVIKDSVVALNPLELKSRGLFILTDSRLQAALPSGGALSAGMEIKKASVMIVDDVDTLYTAEPGQRRGRKEVLSDHLAGFASMGYVPVVTISSAMASLRVVHKTVDLDIRDDLLLIESCADSTQTMLAIFNGLKPPTPEGDEVRYCTEVMPVDMLRSLTEDAFVLPGRRMPGAKQDTDDEEELVHSDEDLPTNLSFVESYYGHRVPLESPRQEFVDSMLEDDPAPIISPSLSREGSSRDSIFKEHVTMLDPEELAFVEDHFGKTSGTRRGRKSLNQDAVDRYLLNFRLYDFCADGNSAGFFPLRVRVREVHAIFNLHDGYDWQRTRDTISQAVRKVETKAAERRNRRVSFDVDDDEDSMVDDFLFNSIYIGIPANRPPGELTNDINKHFDDQISETSYATTTVESARPLSSRSRSTAGDYHGRNVKKGLKLNRSRHHKMQFELKGVNVDFWLLPPGSGEVQLSVDVRVRDLEIFDNVPTSTWRKFVTYCQEAWERESGSDMVRLECLVVKPVPELAATELVIKVCTLHFYRGLTDNFRSTFCPSVSM